MLPGYPSPEAAELAFYKAFAQVDLQAMAEVWLDCESVCCVHPGGGILRGKPEVMQSWGEILAGVDPPRIAVRLLTSTATPQLCVHMVEQSIQAGGNPDAPVNRVIATNVYTCDDTGWHLSTHHASLPIIDFRGGQGASRKLH